MQTCTLAVDIGASSGRHIVGTVQNGKITLQEVYRFENGVHRENGHLCWDIDTLAKEVVNGLKAAHDAGFAPATIGIDTWAVDFVLLDADNKRIGDAVAYRDERTEGIREALEKEYGLTFADHYARTGIQYQPFNTVYQLMALKRAPEQLAAAKTFLMVPDYLNYLLCGVPANEYHERQHHGAGGRGLAGLGRCTDRKAGSAARHLPAHQDRRDRAWASDAGNSEGCRL